MSLFGATSSFEHAVSEPIAPPMFPVAAEGQSRPQRRISLIGRLVRAVHSLRRFCVRTLLPPKSRRLRVKETVSLGDKRFVSIVQVDGVDYLLGGGSATVSLLQQLGPAQTEPTFQQALNDAWGQTETA